MVIDQLDAFGISMTSDRLHAMTDMPIQTERCKCDMLVVTGSSDAFITISSRWSTTMIDSAAYR